MAGRALIAAACLALGVPGVAGAATVDVQSTGENNELFYVADPGEKNRLVVTRDGAAVRFVDPGATVTAGTGCMQLGPRAAECTGSLIVNVELRNRPDRVRANGMLTLRAEGGPGADRLIGGPLGDRLDGGPGPDVLKGRGSGFDTASYFSRSEDLRVTLGDGKRNDGSGLDGAKRDRLAGIENVLGGSGDDLLVGDGKDNSLVGSAGNDVLRGRGGGDDLHGGDGRDRAVGARGPDFFTPGAGNDRHFGGRGRDHFQDGVFDGADLHAGGPGHDILQAQQGTQRLSLDGEANDGQCADPACTSSDEGDNLVSIEELLVGFGDDLLIGSKHNEVFNPFPGADRVFAQGGDDVINVSPDGDVDVYNCGPGLDQIIGTPDIFDQNPNCE